MKLVERLDSLSCMKLQSVGGDIVFDNLYLVMAACSCRAKRAIERVSAGNLLLRRLRQQFWNRLLSRITLRIVSTR